MNDDDARFAVSDRFFLWQEPKGYKVSRSLGRMHSAVDKRYIRIIYTNSPSFTPSSTCVSRPLLLSPPWLQPLVHLLKSRAPWICSTTFRHCESTCTARVRSCSPPLQVDPYLSIDVDQHRGEQLVCFAMHQHPRNASK